MENVLIILSQQFGLQTVIKAVIVCAVMMIVKKIKPNLSPKVEVVIRLALSVLIHLLFTVITNGEILSLTESAMSVCGVSIIFSTVTAKSCDKDKAKDAVSAFLPDLDTKQIDVLFKDCEKADVPPEVAMQEDVQSKSIRS